MLKLFKRLCVNVFNVFVGNAIVLKARFRVTVIIYFGRIGSDGSDRVKSSLLKHSRYGLISVQRPTGSSIKNLPIGSDLGSNLLPTLLLPLDIAYDSIELNNSAYVSLAL